MGGPLFVVFSRYIHKKMEKEAKKITKKTIILQTYKGFWTNFGMWYFHTVSILEFVDVWLR